LFSYLPKLNNIPLFMNEKPKIVFIQLHYFTPLQQLAWQPSNNLAGFIKPNKLSVALLLSSEG